MRSNTRLLSSLISDMNFFIRIGIRINPEPTGQTEKVLSESDIPILVLVHLHCNMFKDESKVKNENI